ncbi:filamentous hemagglutinin N-terminal domain-containing protein, partial [Hyella patelloides]|uniref:two-partner secretion domain-containing protein n=1 Tax=Hyella patelloides TaxID=1982969 RepID=UPI0011A1F721
MKLAPTTIVLSSVFLPLAATAQVTPDGTTSTIVTPTDTGVQIDNGNRAGDNLFHSFGEFSVPTGTEAFFNNTDNIANIFSRVTGGNISNINGLIRAKGTANLFLINPAGIVFGESSRLQLGGSFYGSTADSIIFPDGEFSATDLDNPPLITINAPIGLGFRDEPQPIINDSVTDNLGLQINAGETIGFIGGEIAIRGNGVRPEEVGDINNITAQGAKVWLGGLAEAGTVNLDENLNPRISDNVARANVSFSNGARVDVAGADGGGITVIGNDITLTEASQLFGGIAEGLGTTESQAGDVTINATGAVNLSGVSGIQNRVNEGATGNSGNINVTAESLSITDGGFFSASTFGRGNAGDINVNAEGAVTLDGVIPDISNSRMASVIVFGAEGEGGDITIEAGSLSLTDGALLNTQVFGSSENVNGEEIPGGRGNAGNIFITANSLSLSDGGFIRSSTFGQGNAGNVRLNIAGEVNLTDGNIFSNVEREAKGDGGNITIEAGSLSLESGGQIQTLVR